MKFSKLWSSLSIDERKAFAKKVDTDPGYLQQIATRWRGKKPSLDFMVKLAAAHKKLNVGELAEEFSEPATTQTTEGATNV